ncbi:ROK family protein [Neorhizobium galegae bv. officinalis bv. officinalis str. HAMBI 1141]|uniref:ROK family protein n=1 Tax=Neorhizobium galegae bv. officinalis bv. officinalis str. HAMBI 1141 TaxID=1028801 RepID=A0A068T6N0_NEOGA|nr:MULTISPECIES: ROK family transcriptional regulator [Neorhizobium]MCJ9669825.1 ROK family transcriptional regulator [Neorhizobium sp. SHOUNA12B]MCJ9746242.1 ROK family transcriptional regulator [Neorhizobium sp. SHOUNA12A]CDN53724.1 ROK family protein [Neorhizobium galegae bv. officinalis bv. officinalis str. HAMBI 1141]
MAYFPEALIPPQFLRAGESGVVSPNERSLLKLIWRHPGLSRSEVTDHTDLTQQSVYRIIDQLAERGIVLLGSPKPGVGRGQPSPTIRLNARYAYSCGISVNTDVIGICLMDLAGNILSESSVTLREHTMAQSLDLVRTRLVEAQKLNDLSPEALFGIGFAIAGYHVGGTRYNAPLPLHEWSLIELGPLLAEFFGKPVWVHNGANTGAIAESMFGAGRYVKHFAYLSFNYGFGGGLVSDGELLLGGNGNAGEFSGIYNQEENQRRPALQLLIERLVRNGVDVPSITYMRRHFDPQWPGVAEWVNEITPAYNRLVNAISAIFDPQAIVFGGQVPPDLAQMMIDRTEIFGRPRYGVPRPSPKLIISEIASDASAMGAAITPFHSTFY